MDAMEKDITRFRQPALAVAGGIAAALVIATLPHVYLETVVGTTGLSEIIPAAAPPLGNTARGLVAVMTGLVVTSALYLILNHKSKNLGGGSDMSLAIRRNLTQEPIEDNREATSRFAIPKLNLSARSLSKFLKKPKKPAGQVTELRDLPDVRPADRHPDAPARAPIFASSDLGAPLVDKIKQFDNAEKVQSAAERSVEPEMESAPVPTEPVHATPEHVQRPEPAKTVPQEDELPTAREDLSSLSLAQLTDRLEDGIRRLQALESRQDAVPEVKAPPVPAPAETDPPAATVEAPAPLAVPPLRSVSPPEEVENDRQADMDAALKAALGTLERMTVQR